MEAQGQAQDGRRAWGRLQVPPRAGARSAPRGSAHPRPRPPAAPPPSHPACRARGISAEVARTMLVYSFGREVVQCLRDDALQARVEAAVRAALASFAESP